MKFVLPSAAREDILRQYEYYLIEADAVIAARFLTAVQSAINQICRQPGIGAPKMLNSRTLTGLRSWPVKDFADIRLYYLVSETTLRVVRVVYGKRDLGPIFEELQRNC
jgi:toxin ParE1/3/4